MGPDLMTDLACPVFYVTRRRIPYLPESLFYMGKEVQTIKESDLPLRFRLRFGEKSAIIRAETTFRPRLCGKILAGSPAR